ncbi:hypothetical protein HNP84_004341 [Thermocatellispora tengchongensis]|uniref:Uncharacterized protein n=1 Tax=Thermocatellispora tengchongensis TaxID=1073253 RepID=A0A840P6I5_9ACTN|nr:hypothetical protein [Thermocatellispora tengchongensis]MBB5134609.1 hypothetical protein [Thermocatellispora tengchongensis]
MTVPPEDAARDLADTRALQARALPAEPSFPAWFTTGVALFATGVAFLTEPGTPALLTGIGVAALAAALAAMVFLVARAGRLRLHRDLIKPAPMAGFTGWVLACAGLALAVALHLHTREVAYAGTYGCLAMTAFIAVTSPFLARWMSRRIAGAIRAA